MKKLEFEPKNIIVRMPNWIGDLVMSTVVLTDLRKRFPSAEITAMCKTPLSELLKEDQDINELFSFSRPKNRFLKRKERRDIIGKLRQGGYDLGILLTNSFSSAYLFWEGNVKNRVGFKGSFRSFFLDYPITVPKNKYEQHTILTYKALLEPLGITKSHSTPRLFLTDDEIQFAKELLHQRGFNERNTLIGIHPGAAYGSAKRWPKERFFQLAKKLIEQKDLYVVFVGDDSVSHFVKEISRALGKNIIDLTGATSLRTLCSIIKQCTLFLTNDSGPMHIASAFHIPLVALFGSTSKVMTGPYNKNSEVIDKEVSCSPCFKRECPIDFRCMMNITVDEVYEKIMKLLKK